jgi:two-component system sensor histidine kinase KdpD
MEAVKCKETIKRNNILLSVVSHELRTPIAAIKGYSTMLLDYFPMLTSKETREYIQSIDNATDRLTRLVDNLSETSLLEAGQFKLEKTSVDIASIIKEAVKEAENSDKHHKIVTKMGKNMSRVYVDPKRIRQIIDNLLDNAARYSPKGTKILISAHNNGQELEISITDHSPGTSASNLGSIFNVVNKSEQEETSGGKGDGLGLYICQRFVEAHNGRIWSENTPEQGTTIHFSIPLAPEKSRVS